MKLDLKIKFINYLQIIFFCLYIGFTSICNAQTSSKIKIKTTPAPEKLTLSLPHDIFFQLIDSAIKFEVNHSTEFKHVDLPRKYFNQFTAFIIDSAAAEVTGLKSNIYYNYTLQNGKVINGDIYWNETKSYIVFLIEGKKYVNYYSRDGVLQIKTLFKL